MQAGVHAVTGELGTVDNTGDSTRHGGSPDAIVWMHCSKPMHSL